MFNFFNMANDYEERKVARYEEEGICIDTAAVSDSDQPYETGIQHPGYNDGDWVIVELYPNKKAAQEGHNKWVQIMTAPELPEFLKDVSTANIAKLVDVFGDETWRMRKKI